MNSLRLVIREIAWRKLNFALAAFAAAVAVGALVGSLTLLRAHDARTRSILAAKEAETKSELAKLEDDYRKITLKLGFNILILPKDQNLADLYADDYAAKTMPENYAERLMKSRILTVNHLLPVLQQKLKWTERERTIILIGTRGEVAPDVRANIKELQSAVKPGTIVLGFELWKSASLKPGDRVMLLGREFTVGACHEERGTKDDITAWIDLAEAQQMLDKPGLINAIMAISCQCEGPRLATIRRDIAKILPDTQVIEFASQAIARAEARDRAAEHAEATLAAAAKSRDDLRRERETFAAILVPVAIIGAAAWIAILAFQNVRERRSEIGILRALGMRSAGVLSIFLAKAALTGLIGATIGYAAGVLVGRLFAEGAATGSFNAPLLAWVLILTPVLSMLASWLPALAASREDPAAILGEA